MAEKKSLKFTTFGSRTDVGCVRDHNEDSLVVAPPLFAVADGMGGHAAGEVASEIAVTTLAQCVPEHPDGDALGRAVEEANHAIIRAAREGRGRAGMGTTLTAAMLEGERLVIAQVGDSRAYLLHHGRLQQVTRDHSLMADMIESGQITPEEARTHPNRSIITRALGSDPDTCADIYELNVESGDRLLLCSDGLTTMLRDPDIEQTLIRIQDPQRCAAQLVNEAVAAGGYDNVTVVVADVTGGAAATQLKKTVRKSRGNVALVVALLVAIVAGALAGTAAYLSSTAYLIAQDGYVAIYRGAPGTLMGYSFSQLEELTDVAVDDLQPGTASRLEEGISVESVEAAQEIVQEYREDIAARAGETTSEDDEADEAADEAEDEAETESTDDADGETDESESTSGSDDASDGSGDADDADGTDETDEADGSGSDDASDATDGSASETGAATES